ncbi:MAG: hypothetical protein A6D91_02790 [Bacillaceae bacterium G1]|nr:hypothetical protein [Bacillota bacterium]OJF17909.1 MAG: hypothetical protein A6D91_02790 [Bacillaceae bacterium G1]
MTLDAYLRVRVDAINRFLEQLGDRPDFRQEVPPVLREAMNYSLLAGGKRIRPLLTLAAAEAVSGQWEKWLPFAAAIELVHTYSLIHDDLPAMDDDDFRRGKPTNHKVFGEAMAILAGDALLTHAFTLIARAGREQDVDADIVLQVMEELSWAAGPAGMVGGQVLDLRAADGSGVPVEGDAASLLEQIHRKKTAALIRACVRIGGLLGQANAQQLHALSVYGLHLGLAFQIRDDLLDLTGETALMGKTAGSDQRAGKLTYPRLFGVEQTVRLVQEHTEAAKQALQAVNIQGQWLLEIANRLAERLS